MVLEQHEVEVRTRWICSLQLSLPFTVLKRFAFDAYHIMEFVIVAIVLTVYGIETYWLLHQHLLALDGCNSTYRLRY